MPMVMMTLLMMVVVVVGESVEGLLVGLVLAAGLALAVLMPRARHPHCRPCPNFRSGSLRHQPGSHRPGSASSLPPRSSPPFSRYGYSHSHTRWS